MRGRTSRLGCTVSGGHYGTVIKLYSPATVYIVWQSIYSSMITTNSDDLYLEVFLLPGIR
jgi:hypothetical protein